MGKVLATGTAIGVAVVLAAGVLAGATSVAARGTPGPSTATPTGSVEGIPGHLLAVYQQAAATCPGLPWEVLAAVGFVESRHGGGRVDPATGQVDPPILGPRLDGSGDYAAIPDPASPDGWARAQGPMQFLPGTWRRWGRLAPGRPTGARPDPNNAWDAIHGAAAYLCASGAGEGDVRRALLTYNPSDAYVASVLAQAERYRGDSRPAT